MIGLLLALLAALWSVPAPAQQQRCGRSGLAADCGQRGRLAVDEGAAGVAGKAPAAATPGLAPVASKVDVKAWLQPSWGTGAIPHGDAGEVQGAFRMLCAPGHLSYDDPLLYPGKPGASHLHQWFGNSKGNAFSTYASLRSSGDSSCNNLLNRSAYWIPAMMNGRGKVVQPDWLGVYYKRYPASSPLCGKVGAACVQLPRGLRYVFGYNMPDPRRSDPVRARWWNCDGKGAVSGHFATIADAAAHCPVGARLGGVVVAPDCWNGRDLDSPDHRSHKAYSEWRGQAWPQCPASHPFVIPTFTLQAWYTNDGTAARWRLSSDDMPGMAAMPGGATLHADWFGAWEDSVLAAWHRNCIDKLLSCNSGDLGDGRQLKMLAGYGFPNRTVLVDPPPRPGGGAPAHAH